MLLVIDDPQQSLLIQDEITPFLFIDLHWKQHISLDLFQGELVWQESALDLPVNPTDKPFLWT